MIVLLAAAGGVGAAVRFVVDGIVARHNPFRIPLGTLLINVTGSLLLGFLTGWATRHSGLPVAADVRAVLGTGFCGGYTTFSTATVETVRLWAAESAGTGIRYAALTLLGSVTAAAVGLWLGGLAS